MENGFRFLSWKGLWIYLFSLNLILIGLSFFILPQTLFARLDINGQGQGQTNRDNLLPLLTLLVLAVNICFYFIATLKPQSRTASRINIPNKKYWLATEERKIALCEKLKKLMAVLGSYVNFLTFSTLYMMINYYYPRQIPCPRHLLMLLIWFILSISVVIYSFFIFRRETK